MQSFIQWLENEDYRGYRGLHQAPSRENGSPLHDLTNTYPEDIYSDKAVRYYGAGEPYDYSSIAIIQAAHNRPNLRVKIYRAVPSVLTSQDKIRDFENQKKYILKHGKTPPGINTHFSRSEYYEYISNELEKLKKAPQITEKITINPGDWVSINKQYAVEHGKSLLLGKYRILSKTVKAQELYTYGDSIHEWGYDPL